MNRSLNVGFEEDNILNRTLDLRDIALEYFSMQLELINQKAVAVNIQINLSLLRKYYEEFKNLVVDEDLLIIPVYNKPTTIKSLTLLINDTEGKSYKYDFYEGILYPIFKENLNSYIDSLKNQNIDLPKDTELALLDLTELSEKDIYLFRRILTDANSFSCTIINNIEGDRVRLKRIITGIENAIKGNVKNTRLVETICKNDISISCNFESKYEENNYSIDKLKKEYPNLSGNNEQLVAIDKALQMREKDIDLLLIQGSPGTGKTELILALAKELSKYKLNTLITSNVHVACDNIVDRLKNNKDIVLKRYTSIRGEQYEKEILENKRKYIENQVLEGFKCKENFIKSKEIYDNIILMLDNAISQKQQMLEKRKIYNNNIKVYNDLLQKRKELNEDSVRLKKQLDTNKANIQEIIRGELEIKKKIVEIEAKISNYDNEIIRIKNEIDYNKLESDKQSKICNSLCNALKEQEAVINNSNDEITTINTEIDSLTIANHELNIRKEILQNLTINQITSEVLNNYCNNKPFSNEIYKDLLKSSLVDIGYLLTIYHKLQSDHDFWYNNVMSPQTLEYLYFQNKNNLFLSKYLDNYVLFLLGEAYQLYITNAYKKIYLSSSFCKGQRP